MRKVVTYPKSKHSKTLIILHGMNQDEKDLKEIVKKIQSKKRGIKIIIPVSERILIKWPDFTEEFITSWYKYYSRYDNMLKHDIINVSEFNENSLKIKNIIQQEIQYVNASKIFLCGLSQGGTIAIDTSLKLNFKLGAVLCIDTIFLHSYFDYKNFSDVSQNFIVHQGKNDKIYNPIFQDYCFSILKNYGNSIPKFIFDSEHTESMSEISDFICSKIT